MGNCDGSHALPRGSRRVPCPAHADGYTPLHMAAGYLHVDMVKLLLRYGADPEQPDAKGRSPLELVEDLRRQYEVMNSPALLARRMALEEVAKVLTGASQPPASHVHWRGKLARCASTSVHGCLEGMSLR